MSWHTIVDGPINGPHKSTSIYNTVAYERRKALGLTQAQVAKRARISSCYVSQIENSKTRTVRANAVRKVAKVLGLRPEDLGCLGNPGRRREARQQRFEASLFASADPIDQAATTLVCQGEDRDAALDLRDVRERLMEWMFSSSVRSPMRSWFVFSLRMGLGGRPAMTHAEIGRILGVTRQAVCCMEARAIRTLQNPRYSVPLLRLLGGEPCETTT